MGKQVKGATVKFSKTNPVFTHCGKCNLKLIKGAYRHGDPYAWCPKCGKGYPASYKMQPSWRKYPSSFKGEFAVQCTSKGWKRYRANRG